VATLTLCRAHIVTEPDLTISHHHLLLLWLEHPLATAASRCFRFSLLLRRRRGQRELPDGVAGVRKPRSERGFSDSNPFDYCELSAACTEILESKIVG